jgi:hypothetical protein
MTLLFYTSIAAHTSTSYGVTPFFIIIFLYLYVFIFYIFYIYILIHTSLRQHIFIYWYNSIYVIVKKGALFLLQNAWSLIFIVFCHRPEYGSLKLKPVAWLRVAGACVGCSCTIDKSKTYVGRSNLNENLVPFRVQFNVHERACTDKLWHV